MTAGDPGLIESLIANLVDNAIRYNHPDGHVEITTQTSGAQVTLTVTNSGPVIPGNQLASPALMMPMTERFTAGVRHYIDTRRPLTRSRRAAWPRAGPTNPAT